MNTLRFGLLMLIPIVGTVFLANTGNCQKAFGCSCAEMQSPAKAVSESKTIFSGRILDIESTDYGKVVTFDVDRAWKGVTKERLMVSTPANSAGCGIEFFEEGKEYLVYSNSDEDALSVILCSRTQPIETARGDLAILGEGYQLMEPDDIRVGNSYVKERYDNGTTSIDTGYSTEFYFPTTEITNNADVSKSVVVISMIVDGSNIAREILFGKFTIDPRQTISAGEDHFLWIPQTAGEYTVKNFVWSSLDNQPEAILNEPNVQQLLVKPKILSLIEGQSDDGLTVKKIDLQSRAVTVSHEICAPTYIEREQLMYEGDFALISGYARAYLVSIDSQGGASFEFEGTGKGLCLLICHHATSGEVYLEHYIGR